MKSIFAKRTIINERWHERVRIEITDGKISNYAIATTPSPDDERVDIVLPGIPNTHSHVFQRAFAGRCERKTGRDQDDFWSWRENMFKLAKKLKPDTLKFIARQAFAEMLAAGYTQVTEFHYVHHSSCGQYRANDMFEAIVEAANDVGIRLTYLPILYQRAGFSQSYLSPSQQLFVLKFDDYVDHFHYASERSNSVMNVGLGVHSLRAVSRSSLKKVAALAKSSDCPMHLHIAEQAAEVNECIAAHSTTPIQLLLDTVDVDRQWCLVHVTHTNEHELEKLARTNAVICLCPTTEANLGDGFFHLKVWQLLHGKIAIGSDSQISINPFEELRLLEYGHRLLFQSRSIYPEKSYTHTGELLFKDVVFGGSLASGVWNIPLRRSCNADLVTIKEDNPVLAAHDSKSILDALTFCGIHSVIDQVMVAGKWVVKEGRHIAASKYEKEYVECVRKLWN